ncbi:MAG: hypothetical protein KatS3mg034_1979 [Vicingaceae bacterium]|nr:MAG: hypothetical protein KatS3mg028_1593 [Bacteroidia bacterium]GIV42669.1 MAG: hypothetical protein KatS3mg034_1979 [Vicingaceae bacterium]
MKKIIKDRFVLYLSLISITIIISFIMTLIGIIVSQSRLTGISWGISFGIIAGHFLLCLFLRFGFIFSVIKTIIYCILLLFLYYFISNYFFKNLFFNNSKLYIPFYILSIIISWEISFFFAKKLQTVRISL